MLYDDDFDRYDILDLFLTLLAFLFSVIAFYNRLFGR